MLVSYDPAARATYVQIHEGAVARTVDITDTVMVDLDASGMPLGVEFLQVPADIPTEVIELVADRFPDFKVLLDADRWLAPGQPRQLAAL